MKKVWKVIIAFLIVDLLLLTILGVLASLHAPPQVQYPLRTLYYGETCPHCKNVEAWLNASDPANTLGIVSKEVSVNVQNALELRQRANACGIEEGDLGIPLLIDNRECFVGDTTVIAHLNVTVGVAR